MTETENPRPIWATLPAPVEIVDAAGRCIPQSSSELFRRLLLAAPVSQVRIAGVAVSEECVEALNLYLKAPGLAGLARRVGHRSRTRYAWIALAEICGFSAEASHAVPLAS